MRRAWNICYTALALMSFSICGAAAGGNHPPKPPAQETGFLNRRIDLQGVTYRFQVYVPEDYRLEDRRKWPIILFLHGRGERGGEGMWQTQIGLPLEVRDHPERWPFIIVMPQCRYPNFWTDPGMLQMAMAALDRESAEFHADPARTYLTGISMGGYGAWELARDYPRRWAAIAIAAGGPFWSYSPERWQEAATLPAEYARAMGHTPVWLFHGSEDNVVPVRESELMYNALKSNGGDVRLWIYQGLHHDSWARAYNEPDLPRWLLAHRNDVVPQAYAERIVIPQHPAPVKLTPATLDAIVGEYRDSNGHLAATLFRQGDQLYEKDPHGEVTEVEPESSSAFFYPFGGVWTRLLVERDSQGHVTGLIYRDDRHEERWERRPAPLNAKPTVAER
ncbi:MAG TPA: prolyl oligopeptidase family serine peptidase [Terracidiphilus sp.]|nr:prolyl oligopeptidase family serine peptidase [Terracidiphilus sp.]